MIHRLCNLPLGHTFFLFGARQTGKTTLINSVIGSQGVWTINLLDRSIYHRYLTSPHALYLEAKQKILDEKISLIFIDEVQKVPALLDEVQRLIQEHDTVFVLSGSSARKLRQKGANLLGGRAIERHIYPFTYLELREKFKLEEIMKYGSLPSIVLENSDVQKIEILNSYVSTYLAEEIQQEAIVRNLPGFISFLEVAAQHSGGIINYSNVARDANLQPRTVQSYYEILSDTLIGVRLQAYSRSVRRRLRITPKFYLFDIGVINAIERQLRSEPDVVRYGRLFEHFIVLETHRLIKYLSLDGRSYFWRTKDDQEVDLLIEDKGKLIAAIEIKSSVKVTLEHLKGLRSFQEEYPDIPRFVVARVPESFSLEGGVTVLPWARYFELLVEWLR